MGLTTSLYAIDLDKLKSSIGSRDPELINAFIPKSKKKVKNQKLVVNIDLAGHIFISGVPHDEKSLASEMVHSQWTNKEMDVIFKGGKNPNRISPEQAKVRLLIENLYPKTKMSCLGWLWDWSESDDELSTEQAALELVMGRITRKDCGNEYGYGLQLLCKKLGQHLGNIEGELEASVQWKTKLTKERSPIKLPGYDGFPSISYLTPKEVQGEFEKFSKGTEQVSEKWRKTLRTRFIKFLQSAAGQEKAVVTFCY